MREFIDILQKLTESDESDTSVIKNAIIDMVKTTDEKSILRKVLKTLEAGNLDDRIHDVISTDQDARLFLKQITDAIVHSEASVQEKNEFLEKYPKGIVDLSLLLDGEPHTFGEIVGEGFPEELFTKLSTALVSQGVGPGEVALAVMSPKIKWSGRAAGGGDIIADGKNIEVKTSVKSGGRWINARKANMNLPAIREAIEKASGIEVPARLGIPAWVNTYRPAISPQDLPKVCQIIAKGLFTAADTGKFQQALESENAVDILDEMLKTGYENYKNLSGFDGMLMMDVGSKTAQYFNDYDDMRGSIKIESAYLFGPEGETMPKVSLRANIRKPEDSKDKEEKKPEQGMRGKRAAPTKDFEKVAADIALGREKPKLTKPIGNMGDVGRKRR